MRQSHTHTNGEQWWMSALIRFCTMTWWITGMCCSSVRAMGFLKCLQNSIVPYCFLTIWKWQKHVLMFDWESCNVCALPWALMLCMQCKWEHGGWWLRGRYILRCVEWGKWVALWWNPTRKAWSLRPPGARCNCLEREHHLHSPFPAELSFKA